MPRRFARLRPGAPPFAAGQFGVPADGMCLNVFLVLSSPEDPARVLLGRVAPDPRWEEVGGLDRSRLERIGERWMLPSRQLLLFESPEEAARRIGEEQLGIELGPMPPPQVFSEVYTRPGSAEADPHWDLHFVFRVSGPLAPRGSGLWRQLSYVSLPETPATAFARGHGDVLALLTLPMSGR
jgi:8-oxo-dGTP pyrophosphatase MutT (NUDIX family)